MNDGVIKSASRTDWEKVDALTDEEIDTSDVPALPEEFFAQARWRVPPTTDSLLVMVRVDPEVLAWFQSQGTDYEQRMRAALRIYAEAHKQAA